MLVAAFCAYCPPSVVARKASSPTPQSTAQPQQGETLADPLFTDLLTPHHTCCHSPARAGTIITSRNACAQINRSLC